MSDPITEMFKSAERKAETARGVAANNLHYDQTHLAEAVRDLAHGFWLAREEFLEEEKNVKGPEIRRGS